MCAQASAKCAAIWLVPAKVASTNNGASIATLIGCIGARYNQYSFNILIM